MVANAPLYKICNRNQLSSSVERRRGLATSEHAAPWAPMGTHLVDYTPIDGPLR
jgi:hypothetical protein